MGFRIVAGLVVALSAVLARSASAQLLPTGFAEDVLAVGLNYPTGFTFLPGGRILIANKNGVVRVYKNGALLSTPLIDISNHVNDYWDRGLVGIAADPDFATTGFVYLYYVYEHNAADYTGPKTVRLTRITVVGDTASPGTETVVLGSVSGPSCGSQPAGADCIPADSPSHNGGTIAFAPDKTIYLTTGDASSFTVVDDLAFRALNLDSLAGKLLHITKTGQGLSTNPFWNGDATAPRSKVWAYGFRNPFRASLRPGTSQPYVGDVGWSAYEEVDVAARGANLGWPCWEGPVHQAGYELNSICQSLYAQPPGSVTMPLVSWSHNGVPSSAVLGGVFYTGTNFPPAYQQAYFFADYALGFMKSVKVGTNDALAGAVTEFATGLPGPVQMDVGADGYLYYVAITTGELRRIRYAVGEPPTTRQLSAISWTTATNGWGPVERNLSNGEQAARDGRAININGNAYVNGLGVHANSDIRYRLDGQCTAFDSDVGVDAEVGAAGSVVFEVWVDGVKLYDSGVVSGGMPAKHVALDVTGKQELALIATDAGNGPAADHADWADAKITCGGSGTRLFGPAASLPAGLFSHGVTAQDLNGDGKLDIVAANAGSNNVSVWLGNGNATFGARANFATGATPKDVIAVDLNNDGKQDLVTANQDGSNISVLLGNGTGGFAAAVNYASCSKAHESASGDFNRDGAVDVIVACWGGSIVSLFLGRGDGTFLPRTDIAVGAGPTSVVALDYNNDGLLDAVVANHDSNTLSVLRGNGGGSFSPPLTYPVGTGPHNVRAGDFDRDGRLDLAVANDGSDDVSVLLARVDGTFAAATSFGVGRVPKGVAVGDLDGDGLLDLVATNTAGNYPVCCNLGGDTMTVLHGNGDGTFSPRGTYTVGTTPFHVVIADLDADGHPDVVTANWHSSDVSVLRNLTTASVGLAITGVTANGMTSQSATISWSTNRPADGQVEYGPTTSYGSLSPGRRTLTTTHQELLTDLAPNTVYHYRVRSRDSSGVLAISGDRSFATTNDPPGTSLYLGDRPWTSMTNGWGPAEQNRSNGEAGASDGNVITLEGVTYAKGLGVHAISDIRYAIPTGCTTFVSDAGVDDEVSTRGTVVFQVWGDGIKLFESGVMTGTTPTIQIAAAISGRAELRLVVTDAGDGIASDHADWSGARLLCGPTVNTAPAATISSPSSSLRFKVGDVINYAGSATDPEQGTLPPSSLSWNIVLHHCPGGVCHIHPFLSSTGASGNFTVPDHGEGTFFEITLTATDAGGLTGTSTRLINPQNVTITLDTSPAGMQVTHGGIQATAPVSIATVIGTTMTISTPSPQGQYTFGSWSDGGAQQHNIVAGSVDARYVATFTPASGAQVIYLSNLTWTSMVNGWGPAEKDSSNGEAAAADGRPISLNGSVFTKGLGVHAASDIRYALPTGCSRFQAQIGVDDEVRPRGSITFEVWAAGVKLYSSAVLTGAGAPVPVDVALSGQADLRLVVTDAANGIASDHGDWADARVVCSVNTAPVPTISAPAAGLSFKVGDVITYSGSAMDAEDGTLAASALSWTVTLRHCPSGGSCHSHPFLTSTGASGNFVVADHGDGVSFDIALTATDSGRASATTTRTINPQTAAITLNTVPSGLLIIVGSRQVTAPITINAVVGATLLVSTPAPQGANKFVSWSDSGAQQHNIVVGTANSTYTATFAATGGGTQSTYLSDMNWTSMVNGWGPVEKDRSNGENGAGDGAPITMNGVIFAKGLGAHAASDVQFALPASCSRFQAQIGVDDEVRPNGSIVFEVWAGAVKLYGSPVQTGTGAPVNVDVPLSGPATLRLVITDGGNGVTADHGDWAMARITCPWGP